jgi:hypothetical protein
LLVSLCAQAQDEDLLAPLPVKTKRTHKRKHRPVAKKAPAHEVAPAPAPTPAAPAPAAKAEADDELDQLAPLDLPTTLTVHVGGGVKGAEVEVDGERWGQAPVNAHPLEPGEHRVLVRRPGFADFHKTVTVRAGDRAQVNALLEGTAGLLSIKSTPPGAEVLIDGRAIGHTPLLQVTLPPGSYELRVRAQGYMDDVSRIAVRAGRDYPLELSMLPLNGGDRPTQVALAPQAAQAEPLVPEVSESVAQSPAWYQHWYVWAGVAAVAAGATAGVLAATSKAPSPISASSVCGGNCDAVLSPP